MKKKKTIFFTVGIILISLLYLLVRLYRLDERIEFSFDPAIHVLETKEMFDSGRIKLIGPASWAKSFNGRYFYIGANYYYLLGIVGLVGQWNPLVIVGIFIFIELFFYIFFVYFLKNKFGQLWAILVFIFIALSPYLIIHSRFWWNPHFLIPLSILVLYFGNKFILKGKMKYLFLMAFCWGFAFSCHYSGMIWGLFFIYFLIKSKKIKELKTYLIIILGFVSGDLPWVIFEIKHNFYNTKTFWYILQNSPDSRGISSHYFVFSLFIFAIFGVLVLIKKIKNQKQANLILIILLFSLFIVQRKLCFGYKPLEIIPGWSYVEQQKAISLITKDGCPKNFNVASTISGDTRSYDLRFLLIAKDCKPMGVEEYSKSEKLFLIAPVDRPPETETVWEVSSLGKFKINRQEKISKDIVFWELEKIKIN